MVPIESHLAYAKLWGDDEVIRKFRTTPSKSKEAITILCENVLKDLAARFDRSPHGATLSFWAKDLVDAGCNDLILKEALKTVPFKFERCPTLAQIMELVRPHLHEKSFSESELDKYTRLVKDHAKTKFKALVGEDTVERMIGYYRKEVCKDFTQFHDEQILTCIVFDWIRTYCSSQPAKIIEQGKISNQKAIENDQEYFVTPLRRYAKENNLHID